MSDEHILEDFILKHGENHKKILDVGCGDGELLIELARRNSFSELWCVDIYIEDALNNIMRAGFSQRIKCVAAKAEDIPFESRFFDFIYSIRSLHEFYNPVKALKEIRRLLTPNGEMIIIDWKKGAYTGAFERYYGKGELRKFLEQAGIRLRNVKMKEIGRFNVLLYFGMPFLSNRQRHNTFFYLFQT